MHRPTSVTVFGILNILFSVMGILGIAASALVFFAMPQLAEVPQVAAPDAWTIFSLVWGAVGGLVLLISGIGLLAMRSWARLAAIGYAVATIAMTVVGLAFHWFYVVRPTIELAQAAGGPPPEAIGASIGGLFGGCVGPVYPVLLWYFMTRRNVVVAFGGTPAADSDTPWSPPMPARNPQDATNPYVAPQTDAASWPGPHAPPAPETVVQTFVPTRNGPALASYYLGLFSLFPCLGLPLGVAAVYFGVQGLRRVRADASVRGGVHAWAGVICGSLFGLANLALVALLILGLLAA